ncbi:PID-CTERM protein-sorting domain-containing protein [Hymenobacter cheonanensis]|uniref:PID-CTERM protein-sorting domain-containing protein n=1 Tax=Hymenobacter sp. CA2-7 TaxID=3063993 RepID=UPI002713F436|nr:hypothetical protein [Hymenobacter sp. CA2-7]MDO7886017.1 hypothetical protein [Hymenobacter sp. CA2-7]
MKNKFLLNALATTAIGLLLTATAARAQAPGSGGPTPGNTTPDPTQVPIDGGASLLLASGVAFGLKKLRDRRKAR